MLMHATVHVADDGISVMIACTIYETTNNFVLYDIDI